MKMGYHSTIIVMIQVLFKDSGIGTIIKMATIYGSEIGVGMIDL